jgi:hypothetical protein
MIRENTDKEIELVQETIDVINGITMKNRYELSQNYFKTYSLFVELGNSYLRIFETKDLNQIYAYLHAVKTHLKLQGEK